MKVLVISDTHGNVTRALTAHACAEPVDAVIHLGDGCADAEMLRDALDVPVIAIAGNCDPGSDAPRELVWECEGKRLLLTHGDAYRVKSGLVLLLQRAVEIGVDAVLFGHTHRSVCETYSGLLLINPGSLAGYSTDRRYAILTITPQGISCRHFACD
jgi:putative phosphoesterase